MQADIRYAVEPALAVGEFIDLLRRSTLAERRPVDDIGRIARMLAEADIVLCARDRAGKLVGVSRAITDFSYCCYLSDLAVDATRQRGGIGRELIRRTHEQAGGETMLILLAAPKALDYYPHIGMDHCERAFTLARRR